MAGRFGLTVHALARWPLSDTDTTGPLPGFLVSSYSPLVAEVAERCLWADRGQPVIGQAEAGAGTAVVLVGRQGDAAFAAHVARTVASGGRVAPLLFFQSVPNAVAGHVAARWGLTGPVACVEAAAEPLAEGFAVAALMMSDGDADAALVVHAEQSTMDGVPDRAVAVLVRGGGPAGDTPWALVEGER